MYFRISARRCIKRIFAIICIFAAATLIEYIHLSRSKKHTSVYREVKVEQNIPHVHPTTSSTSFPHTGNEAVTSLQQPTTSQQREKPTTSRKSIDKGACAIVTNSPDMADKKECKLPNLDPFNPYVVRSIKPVTSLNCSGRLFTEYENNVFRLLDDVNEAEHQIEEVVAEPIYRDTDSDVKLGEKKILNLTNRVARINGADFLKVTVRFKNGKEQTDIHASISEIPDVAQRQKTHSSPLNIMILAFDGTSAAHFQRMLPKTYAFLKDGLDSIIFKGYSVVGESTTPAMSAFLTGKSERENNAFKEARQGFENADFLDEWPFIFKELKRLGVATMWSEDQPGLGAFNFRLKGFRNQPTDHYGRTLWLQWKGLCMNSQSQFEVQLKYLKSFMKSYPGKRKFGFTFFSDLCHREPGLVHAADGGLISFFESLKNENLLNDTMFITLSDHGARFEVVRKSPQGKLEQRLPFLSLTFPPWFKRNYPEHFAALAKNTRIITSPFDVHATMKHLIAFPDKRFVETGGVGASLFDPLPEGRACKDAGIPENYCPCLSWQPINISHPHVHEAVKVALSHINKLLVSYPMADTLCHQLELKTISEAYQKMPSGKTHLNVDIEDTTCSYQIQFQTTPGDGLFEGLLKINASGDFKVFGEVDRVNMYGDQPKCIAEYMPSMRPYCLCK